MGDPEPVPKKRSGMSEAEVIRSEELLPILHTWYDRAVDSGEWDPLGTLGERIGMDEAQIRRTLEGRYKHVSLRNADKLLCGIGRPDYLANGRVTIIPNPRWSMEHYMKYMEERGCI